MAIATAELTWISHLLKDVGVSLSRPPSLFCDNLSALYMTVNLILHGRTKYIEVDYHFVRENVAIGNLITHFVPFPNQLADIFTKPLAKMSHLKLWGKLDMRTSPLPHLKRSVKT